MKKLSIALAAALLAAAMALPASAAAWKTKTLTSTFDKEPDWYKNATVVELEDQWKDGATNARCGTQQDTVDNEEIKYVFLKDNGKGDYTVEFTVDKAGTYNIGFELMAWSKGAPRATTVKIDDSEFIDIRYDYADDDSDKFKDQFYTGLSIELTAGKHTLTMSLPSDWDDKNVKSLYFDNFFYALVETPKAATTSPNTFDPATIAIVSAAAAAGAAFVVSKKR